MVNDLKIIMKKKLSILYLNEGINSLIFKNKFEFLKCHKKTQYVIVTIRCKNVKYFL